MKENELIEAILGFIKEFENNKDLFNNFLSFKIPNFLCLKKDNLYSNIIKNYKESKKKAYPFVKGYKLTISFKKWLFNNFHHYFELILKMDKNSEILQYVIYTLLYETKRNKKDRKSLKEISKYIGVSRWSITQSALLLDDLGVIDFDEKFGLDVLQYKSKILKKRAIGILAHKAINNILTKYFKNEYCNYYFSEPYILLPLSTKHPDGLIILKKLNEYIKKNIEEVFSKKYDFIIVDYTFYSLKRIANKLRKYFPPKNVLFLIICYDLKEDICKIDKLYLPDNVQIISLDFFMKLIRLNYIEYNEYFKLLSEVILNVNKKNINDLSRIVEKTTTPLYNTQALRNRLKTENLSDIFYRKYNQEIAIKFYISLIRRDLSLIKKKLKLSDNCIHLSNEILKYLVKCQRISPLKDYLSYVATLIYLSARYLYLPKINRKIITSTLGISSHGFKLRIIEIKKLDLIFTKLIYPYSLKELLKIFNIKSKKCYDLSLHIMDIAHFRVYRDQEEINFALPLTAFYLSTNNLGIKISQEKIIDIVSYEYRTVIFNVLRKLREYSYLFKEIGIDLVDPIKKKEMTIIKALNNSNGLTSDQIQSIIKIDPLYHLQRLVVKNLIRRSENKYFIINQGRIITTFAEFFSDYKENQKTEKYTSNKHYYEEYPYVSKGTIRGWISRAHNLLNK